MLLPTTEIDELFALVRRVTGMMQASLLLLATPVQLHLALVEQVSGACET